MYFTNMTVIVSYGRLDKSKSIARKLSFTLWRTINWFNINFYIFTYTSLFVN